MHKWQVRQVLASLQSLEEVGQFIIHDSFFIFPSFIVNPISYPRYGQHDEVSTLSSHHCIIPVHGSRPTVHRSPFILSRLQFAAGVFNLLGTKVKRVSSGIHDEQ